MTSSVVSDTGIRAVFGRKLDRPMALGFDTAGVLKIIPNLWDLLVKNIPSKVVGHGGRARLDESEIDRGF